MIIIIWIIIWINFDSKHSETINSCINPTSPWGFRFRAMAPLVATRRGATSLGGTTPVWPRPMKKDGVQDGPITYIYLSISDLTQIAGNYWLHWKFRFFDKFGNPNRVFSSKWLQLRRLVSVLHQHLCNCMETLATRLLQRELVRSHISLPLRFQYLRTSVSIHHYPSQNF